MKPSPIAGRIRPRVESMTVAELRAEAHQLRNDIQPLAARLDVIEIELSERADGAGVAAGLRSPLFPAPPSTRPRFQIVTEASS